MQILILSILCIVMVSDNKIVIPLSIAVAIVENTLGLQAISSGPPALLDIPLETLRDTVVHNESHISLVNSHPKRDGGDYHLDLIVHPLWLDVLPSWVGEFRMVEIAFDLVLSGKSLADFLAIFARYAVDDARFALETSVEKRWEVLLDVLESFFVADLVDEIWAIKTRLEANHFVFDSKTWHNVVLDLNGCSCC